MRHIAVLSILSCLCVFLPGCAGDNGGVTGAADDRTPGQNLLLEESTLPYQLPPFDQIQDTQFGPAFEQAMALHLDEIDVIANAETRPTVDNTIIAMERAGRPLARVRSVFFGLTAANTTDTLDAIDAEFAPKLAAHNDQIRLNPRLFARVKTLYDERLSLDLAPETLRLAEKYYTDFVRAGAALDDTAQARLRSINAELATLRTEFTQRVLAAANASAIVVDSREELAGLSENQIAAASAAASARNLDGQYVLPLLNTSGQPSLASLESRALRERIMDTSLSRGLGGGEFDTRELVVGIVGLRAERAQLLGYRTHADYVIEQQTAQSVSAVTERLARFSSAAVANARREAGDLQAMILAEGGEFALAPWDWAYYTEQIREDRYAFDASQLRPYFELNNVLSDGVFFAAKRLYGLTFVERADLRVYHPDVRIFEVFDADGTPLALFLGDFYARPSKSGGAWMRSYVSQSHLLGTRPVVANHLNIPRPPDGEPTLLTFDEVVAMFHEFGHALHGLFSDVQFPYFSGTSVPRDFVEYPSQVNQMWATWPEVLSNYAVHFETGEPMPMELIEKVLAIGTFNQGFATTEYLAAAQLDMAWHQLTPEEVPSADGVVAFEAAALETAGVALDVVPPRYRSTYFSHVFPNGYSAGYYSYIWSELLDADSVEWFKENGGLTRANGDHFRRTLLSKGGSAEAMDLYRSFRGAEPELAPLLTRRGLN